MALSTTDHRFRDAPPYRCPRCERLIVLSPCPICAALSARLTMGDRPPLPPDVPDGEPLVIPPPAMPTPEVVAAEFSPKRLERLGERVAQCFITHPRARPPENPQTRS